VWVSGLYFKSQLIRFSESNEDRKPRDARGCAAFRPGRREQWIQLHPETGSSWFSWPHTLSVRHAGALSTPRLLPVLPILPNLACLFSVCRQPLRSQPALDPKQLPYRNGFIPGHDVGARVRPPLARSRAVALQPNPEARKKEGGGSTQAGWGTEVV